MIKLGRSVKPVTRLSQWRSQCPSREPVVRGVFPGADTGGLNASLQFAPRGTKHHHKWERLCLIEVAGRASSDKTECADCGKVHVELFHVESGAYELWVRDIVERWGRWCRDVLE